MAATGLPARGRRVPVTERYPVAGYAADYADAFAVDAAGAPPVPLEDLFRTTLDGWPARPLVGFAHRRLLRFQLAPRRSPEHVHGWRIVTAEPDVVVLRALSPWMSGHLVGRRSGGEIVLTTFLRWARPGLPRLVWALVGPAHRRVTPHLLARCVRG